MEELRLQDIIYRWYDRCIECHNEDTSYVSSGWIRNARLGSSSKASFDPAFVGRVDYTGINGLMAGASVYYGGGSNLKDDETNDVSGLTTTMIDIHASYDKVHSLHMDLYTNNT